MLFSVWDIHNCILHLQDNPTKLREVLSYHMATPSLQANDIANNHMATTRADHPLRINLYSRVRFKWHFS